jgi:predicted DNA-binding transcriptional regulator YafY
MDPAARLLRLLSLLQSRPTWPARELAERLAVDPRTIRRDVARLRSLGYPVHTSPGLAGYELGAGGRLPPLLLDDEEAVAVAIGLRVAATAAVTGVESAAVAAMAKLDQVLPGPARDRVRSLQSSTVHLESRLVDPVDPATLSLLASACRSCERVRFSYRAFAGQVSERRVEPSQIVFTDRRWYLVALDLDRDDWRTFRVDRVSAPVLTGHRFERRDAPDAVARVAEATTFGPTAIEAGSPGD